MNKDWIYQVAVICPLSSIKMGEGLAFQLTKNASDLEGNFFSRDVERISDGVITHRLAFIVLTIDYFIAVGQFKNIISGSDVKLIKNLQTGESFGTIEQWLEEKGLCLYFPPYVDEV